MKLIIQRRTIPIHLAILAIVLTFALPPTIVRGQAAQAPPREMISVAFVTIHPEMVNEFEAFIKNETNPALQKGGVKWRQVWQTATFGPGFSYVVVSPIDSFAMYDGIHPLEKALGKDGMAAYRAKQTKFFESVRTIAVVTRPDLSYMGKPDATPKMAIVSNLHIAPGKNAEFESFLSGTILPAMAKTGTAGYWVNQTILGGDASEYTTLFLIDNYAEIDKGSPLERAFGKEGAATVAAKGATGVILGVERTVAKHRPDLSYDTTAAATPK